MDSWRCMLSSTLIQDDVDRSVRSSSIVVKWMEMLWSEAKRCKYNAGRRGYQSQGQLFPADNVSHELRSTSCIYVMAMTLLEQLLAARTVSCIQPRSTGVFGNMAKANGKGGAQPTTKFMPHQRLAHIRNAQQLLATTRPPERLIILG